MRPNMSAGRPAVQWCPPCTVHRRSGTDDHPTQQLKHCTALHCTALHYAALHCTALRCSALHYTALRCSALPPLLSALLPPGPMTTLYRFGVIYSAVQCTVNYSAVQCSAVQEQQVAGSRPAYCMQSGGSHLLTATHGTALQCRCVVQCCAAQCRSVGQSIGIESSATGPTRLPTGPRSGARSGTGAQGSS
jgi:hypothetical protein